MDPSTQPSANPADENAPEEQVVPASQPAEPNENPVAVEQDAASSAGLGSEHAEAPAAPVQDAPADSAAEDSGSESEEQTPGSSQV